jgi:hypothetical protein
MTFGPKIKDGVKMRPPDQRREIQIVAFNQLEVFIQQRTIGRRNFFL